MKKVLEIGGWIAGIVLVVFGVIVIAMSWDARNTVRDSIAQENIKFGSIDDEAVQEYAEDWAGEPVKTGEQARAFAKIMREHITSITGGLTYAEMGRYLSADDPENPAGTSNADEALLDSNGDPVPNTARETWVTETALTTALNMSYLAEQLSVFSTVVGISLVIVGLGFLVLNWYNVLGPKFG